MQIPLFVLLIMYGVGLVIWLVLTLFTLYQVLRYGTFTRVPLISFFVFLAISISIVGVTWLSIRTVDWNSEVDLSAPSITIPTTIPSIFPTTSN